MNVMISFYYHYYYYHYITYHIFCSGEKKFGYHRVQDGGDLEQLW